MNIRCDYCYELLDSDTITKSVCCPHCGKQFTEDFIREAIKKLGPTLDPKIISEFGLTIEQTRIYFSYLYFLTWSDIDNETNEEKKNKKKQWLKIWKNSSENFLKAGKIVNIDSNKLRIITNYSLLKKEVKNLITNIDNNRTLYYILMEISFFTPYYTLYTKEVDYKNKPFKKLNFNHIKAKETLNSFANSLDLNKEYIGHFISARKKAFNGITNRNLKKLLSMFFFTIVIAVTGGLAAPAIGALFAPAGLFGAAAVSAGLAALGGGAIAAGGLGMAGGTAVIIGGGALLGAGIGSGFGSIISASPKFTLLLSIKLEVAIRIIALKFQNNTKFAQKILDRLKTKIDNSNIELQQAEKNLEEKNQKKIDLKNTLNKLENESDENKEKIISINHELKNLKEEIKKENNNNNNLQKSLKYLQIVLKRNQDYIVKYNK